MNIPLHELKRMMEAGTPLPLTLIRYEHGGGRLCKEEPRTLVADFFDEADRELFYAMRNALPSLLAACERAQAVLATRNGPYAMCDHVTEQKAMDNLREALAPFQSKEK